MPVTNPAIHEPVQISIGSARSSLPGDLSAPASAAALVIFAHGSGSSRLSPRNRAVAEMLNRAGFATLLFDLLTDDEADDRRNVFDIPLLAGRVLAAVSWAQARAGLHQLPIAILGASTGAAAALTAAARDPRIRAVISRGGRPDLAADDLPRVTAPTLLIIGGDDEQVIQLNESAYAALAGPRQLSIISGATHLFEEPGAIEQVAALAVSWLNRYLSAFAAPEPRP